MKAHTKLIDFDPWPEGSAAVDAMHRVQLAIEARKLSPVEPDLLRIGAVVVAGLNRRDVDRVRLACEVMVEVAESLPVGSYVWELPKSKPSNAAT